MLRKFAITGPESTGKSTLSKQLAEYYNCELVEEYAREYIDKLTALILSLKRKIPLIFLKRVPFEEIEIITLFLVKFLIISSKSSRIKTSLPAKRISFIFIDEFFIL